MSAVVRSVARRLQRVVPRVRRGVSILAYHLVGAESGARVDVPTARFEADLQALGERLSSLGEALDRLGGPGHRVVLTFDDAYANFYETVYPLLQRHAAPALLYAPTDFVAGMGRPPIRGTERLGACTPAQLREMAESGLVTIGAHTVTHPDLPTLGEAQAERELADARKRLEDWIGRPVRHFCYPRARWSRRHERLVRAHYDTAALAGGWQASAGTNRYRLPRLPITADLPPSEELVRYRVWLEEALADATRRWR